MEEEFENLTRDEILNISVIETVLAIPNADMQERMLAKLEIRAKELKILSNFRRLLKAVQKENDERNVTIIDKNKITHDEVAKQLLKNNNLALFENEICIYEDGVYKQDEETLYKKIIEILPTANTYFRKEVYNYLLLIAPRKYINKESGIINFKNGLFNINTKEFKAHTPEYFSINQLNVNLNFEVEKVQAIEDVLNKLSCNISERKQAILEMIGYSMTTSVKLQKAFVLYGKTAGNGKSTLINIISDMIGKSNIGNVTLDDLSNNKFASSGIKGKLLNVGSEMTKEYLKDVSTFKQWITGDDLEVEEKFKAKQTISPYAKFIFNANELPKVADKTNGFYRRLHIIPFEAKFTKQDNKSFNFDSLVTKQALEYLAKISIEAYMNINLDFANYEESNKEIEQYKIENNNALVFINDKEYMKSFLSTGTAVKRKTEVYSAYKSYCKENEFKPMGKKVFYDEISRTGLVEEGLYLGYNIYKFDKDIYM
ncbi:MAG: hypothetical protein HFJ20_03250 [Clostridia bacterium]|nr:hypothetical protein [Clostridia bacterium]